MVVMTWPMKARLFGHPDAIEGRFNFGVQRAVPVEEVCPSIDIVVAVLPVLLGPDGATSLNLLDPSIAERAGTQDPQPVGPLSCPTDEEFRRRSRMRYRQDMDRTLIGDGAIQNLDLAFDYKIKALRIRPD